MKIHRLLEIVTILLNKNSVTAGELAERFEVSTRTVYRDIEALSEAGVPVYMRTGHGGGISLMEDYTLQKSLISKEESENLILALKTLQAANFPNIEVMLDKVGSLFKNTDAFDWFEIDFSRWGSQPDAEDKFSRIKEAIVKKRVVEFDYVNADGGKSRRKLEPMRIVFKSQTWYIWGFCRFRNDFRVFRLSRIRNLIVTDEVFERRAEPLQPEESVYLKPMVTLKLRFTPSVIFRVFDDYDEEYIRRNGDGTVDVAISVPEDEWIYGYILSFGNGVKVLEPRHVREKLKSRLREIMEMYDEQ
jgi:predicted DNA-binding transcriptional regulator YafY